MTLHRCPKCEKLVNVAVNRKRCPVCQEDTLSDAVGFW